MCKKRKRIYWENISEIEFSSYKYLLYYAEILDHLIAEFPHSHPMYQIYYMLQGPMQIEIEDELVELKTNVACILPCNVAHKVVYEPCFEKRYYSLIFNFEPLAKTSSTNNGPDGEFEFQDIMSVLERLSQKLYFIRQMPPETASFVEKHMEELRDRKLGWNTTFMMMSYHFVIQTLRMCGLDTIQDTAFSGYENIAMSGSKYIHKHYKERYTLGEASEDLNVSSRHLNRSYEMMFNRSFISNTNYLRVQYAKDYLSNTDLSIDVVAAKVGFSSEQTLYRLFKKYEGITIGEYRRKIKKEIERREREARNN